MKWTTSKTPPQDLAFAAWQKKANELAAHMRALDQLSIDLEVQRRGIVEAFPELILPPLPASPEGATRINAELMQSIIRQATEIRYVQVAT